MATLDSRSLVGVVILYVWIFHIEPPHDEEYGRWLFFSLLHTALPWVYCSIPLGLVVVALDSRHRPRRIWITVIWTGAVICLAWVTLRTVFHSSPPLYLGKVTPIEWITLNVEVFAIQLLFPALFVLATLLWIEKRLVKKGLLA
jgi:hypothetical protein